MTEKQKKGKKKKTENIFLIPVNIGAQQGSEEKIEPIKGSKENLSEILNTHFPEIPKEYFKYERFINPTHNNSNHIASNTGLMSHSLTHFKISDTFIEQEKEGKKSKKSMKKYNDGNPVINFNQDKIKIFKTNAMKDKWYQGYSIIIEKVTSLLYDFNKINPENKWGVSKNDILIFVVMDKKLAESYTQSVNEYVNEKMLKYPTFEGKCECCDKENTQLYMIVQGNIFDITKDRKFLLRHPTRYGSDLKAKSTQNYNICSECAKTIDNFFEFLRKRKYYRFVVPVFPEMVSASTEEYDDYSPDSKGLLSHLKRIYEKLNRNPFDYIMVLSDNKFEEIQFRYVSDFDYFLEAPAGIPHINELSLYTSLKPLSQNDKETGISRITNERTKMDLLMDLNLYFNNLMMTHIFSNVKDITLNIPSFLKQKIGEYNTVIGNCIFYQDKSLFKDHLFGRMAKEILEEVITNKKYREELKISNNKIAYYLCLYYKYIVLEEGGNKLVEQYLELSKKLEQWVKESKDENGYNEKLYALKLTTDFEASYCAGQLFYYLLQVSKVKNRVEQFSRYTFNVSNMNGLKKRLVDVLEKYSHNEYLDTNRYFQIMIKEVLNFEFKKPYDENKIALWTGYFDKNILYSSSKEREEVDSGEEEEGDS
ncbi:MAG: hypothetical protein QW728_01855 [Thermoplasmata archaeon]